jgi:RTA1 like protein
MSNSTLASSDNFAEDGYFGFQPIKGLEIAALIIYCILTVLALTMNIRKKSWFMNPIVAVSPPIPIAQISLSNSSNQGGVLEIIGFAARIWETSNNQSEAGYIVYLVPVIVAPTVLAAANYSLTSIM